MTYEFSAFSDHDVRVAHVPFLADMLPMWRQTATLWRRHGYRVEITRLETRRVPDMATGR